jgi:DNA-binding YbaB/EbfC family protein
MSQQQQMMRQLAQMQQAMAAAQAEIAAATVTGTSGGGMVTVIASGSGQVTAITIDPAAVDVDDLEMLEDMLVAAVNDARRAGEALSQQRMGAVTGGLAGLAGGLGLNLPGM